MSTFKVVRRVSHQDPSTKVWIEADIEHFIKADEMNATLAGGGSSSVLTLWTGEDQDVNVAEFRDWEYAVKLTDEEEAALTTAKVEAPVDAPPLVIEVPLRRVG